MYDVIVAGAGPAGLTAAIYASRAGLKTLVLEKMIEGGQMTVTAEIENYPGVLIANGAELGAVMKKQAETGGAEFRYGQISDISADGAGFRVLTAKEEYRSKTVVYAAGAVRRQLGIPGEARFAGRGVSGCATCDGAFFKGRDVAVVGGGNTALEDALYLSRFCGKVFLIHRRDAFRGMKSLVDRVRKTENIILKLSRTPEEILGDVSVSGIRLRNLLLEEEVEELVAAGVFIAVGLTPETGCLSENVRNGLRFSESGHITAGEDCVTGVPGFFAAGDVREKRLYQIATAVSDGANAAGMAEKYIEGLM